MTSPSTPSHSSSARSTPAFSSQLPQSPRPFSSISITTHTNNGLPLPFTPPTVNTSSPAGTAASSLLSRSLSTTGNRMNGYRHEIDFEIIKQIGSGGFGRVYLVRQLVDDQLYALKQIPLRHTRADHPHNIAVLREASVLSRINHPHLVRYYNSWIEGANTKPIVNSSDEEEEEEEAERAKHRRRRSSTTKSKLNGFHHHNGNNGEHNATKNGSSGKESSAIPIPKSNKQNGLPRNGSSQPKLTLNMEDLDSIDVGFDFRSTSENKTNNNTTNSNTRSSRPKEQEEEDEEGEQADGESTEDSKHQSEEDDQQSDFSTQFSQSEEEEEHSSEFSVDEIEEDIPQLQCNICQLMYYDWEVSFHEWQLLQASMQPLNLCESCYTSGLQQIGVDVANSIHIQRKPKIQLYLFIQMEYCETSLEEEIRRLQETSNGNHHDSPQNKNNNQNANNAKQSGNNSLNNSSTSNNNSNGSATSVVSTRSTVSNSGSSSGASSSSALTGATYLLWSYFEQLLHALKFLHSQKIIHRDIKPGNILINREKQVKLGDLGLAKITTKITPSASGKNIARESTANQQQNTQQQNKRTKEKKTKSKSKSNNKKKSKKQKNKNGKSIAFDVDLIEPQQPRSLIAAPSSASLNSLAPMMLHSIGVGSHFYTAPETLFSGHYNEKVDMFSCGIVLFEMFWPFSTQMERLLCLDDLRTKGIFPPDFIRLFPVQTELIRLLIQSDPEKRPSAAQLLAILPHHNSAVAEAINHPLSARLAALQGTIQSQQTKIATLERTLQHTHSTVAVLVREIQAVLSQCQCEGPKQQMAAVKTMLNTVNALLDGQAVTENNNSSATTESITAVLTAAQQQQQQSKAN